jgi:hypothetical protein
MKHRKVIASHASYWAVVSPSNEITLYSTEELEESIKMPVDHIGFFLGVSGELDISVRGSIYGILSSLFVAFYAIVTKWVIGLLDGNSYVLMEYNTPIAIVVLLPIVYFSGEFDVLSVHQSRIF